MKIKPALFNLIWLGSLKNLCPLLWAGESPVNPAALPADVETFAHADDGTPLTWKVYTPSGVGKHPVVLMVHGGGFVAAAVPELWKSASVEVAAAGFLVLEVNYRLAPPGHIAGQVSSGRYPDQTTDVHLAVHTARFDPRGNGQVGAIGGSSGGYLTAYAALTGTAGDDQLDVGVCLSGVYDLPDPASLGSNANYKAKLFNYIGSEDPHKLLAASPVSFVTAAAPPLFLVQSSHEQIPPPQLPTLTARLLSAGVTSAQQQLTIPGNRHSMLYWEDVKEPVIAFLKSAFNQPTLKKSQSSEPQRSDPKREKASAKAIIPAIPAIAGTPVIQNRKPAHNEAPR